MAFQLDTFNKMLLETVGVGLIIASYPDLRVVFRNSLVLAWLPEFDAGEGSLDGGIAGLDAAALRTALDAGETYKANMEVKVRRRIHALSLVATRAVLLEGDWVIIELHNVTKVHELESMISSYSGMVERQNRLLKKEKERAEKLLLNIMPESVYHELKTFGVTTPQRFDEASILMLDFVGFTQMSVEHDPATIVSELNDIFTAFDRIAEHQGCERIKTMGDAYVAVAGLPEPNPDHAPAIARLALLCLRYLKRRNETQKITWRCRIGLAPGPVIGSVVGIQKYVYDIFGPGINLASRLEALAGPMEVLLSEEMHPRLRAHFQIEERGEVELRGFGRRRIYHLLGAENLQVDAAAFGD
ncbi:adenylate/guanylate cyclase domain-containing protein [Pelagibius sp. 7325]|uniref:adenylate/guanylate cyclase domain-containing protein n=1 Tax=Pelagibius sp. 7325 TaxID=3131994 RepID=UPI0030EF4D69